MKFTSTDYNNSETIHKFANIPFVGVAVMVEDNGIEANDDGKKIVPAGTVVGGVNNPVLQNLDGEELVNEKNTQSVPASLSITAMDGEDPVENSTVVITANATGENAAEGEKIKVALLDPSGNDKDLSVSISGDTINVSLATDGTGAITSTAEDVVNAINAHLIAQGLVTASLGADEDGTGLVKAAEAAALDNASAGTGYLAEGVLEHDVDVTHGDAPGTMLIYAYVDEDKLDTAPCDDARKALNGKVTFISAG